MGGVASRAQGSVRDRRRVLAERLRENAPELEETIFDRICALEDAASPDRPPMQGIRTVIRSALMHGFESVELGEQSSSHPPPAAIDHARKSAWRSISLQTLYDRYFAAHSVFQHFLLRESDSVEIAREVQGPLDVAFHRLIRAIGEEHQRELQKRSRSSDLRRLERVQELLSGELLEAPDLQYPFEGMHVGVVASGPEISSMVRQLFRHISSQMLLVSPALNRAWAWVNVRRDLPFTDPDGLLSADLPPGICISIGEPAEGATGWRLSHRQALAARLVALRRGAAVVQFSNVALLASALGDELLLSSLTRQYLHPLSLGRDGGKSLRETLRAYFRAERHISSAANLLGVKRHTVTNRLRIVEERLGCSPGSCAAELEVALRLEDLVLE